jgi:C-terminal processing protease CtpA/Prc
VGIIRVPGFQSTNPALAEAFANTLRGHLEAQAAAGACAWIIDLRSNTGGNMYPMIQGLSGLLGGEILGYFVGRQDRDAWSAGRFGAMDVELHVLPGGTKAPVAALQGPRTASSGEATLLSFVGRENTRRFGEPSMGLSTANGAYKLGDGATLVLTTALMADRGGQVYGGRIPPEEAVKGEKETEEAALRWLEAQPGCAD